MNEFERGELNEENLWLDRLKDVVANDPDATQNWYIPLQLLDFVGFDVEEIQEWATSAEMKRDENRNEIVNSVVSQWIEGRLIYNARRGVQPYGFTERDSVEVREQGPPGYDWDEVI